MVVAITDGAQTTTLPTGHELLQAHDLLAVSGSAAALERARAIIKGGVRARSRAGVDESRTHGRLTCRVCFT